MKPRMIQFAQEALRVDAAVLILSLVAGAYLMAVATASPNCSWLGWFTLFPLFVAIRVQRPLGAMLSGAVWGLCLYLFLPTGGGVLAMGAPGLGTWGMDWSSAGGSPALLTTVPAIYALLGAALTRWIGFSPFVLGVGWMGVELALAPLGLRYGLLAGAQADAWFFPAVGHLLGYVFVAFLAAYVSALIVAVLTRVAVSCSDHRRVFNAGERANVLVPQTFRCFPLYIIPACQPRAPPVGNV